MKIVLAILLFFSWQSSSSEASPPNWFQEFEQVYRTLEENLHPPTDKIPFYSAHPAPKFPQVYLWDSAFIAIVWKYHNPRIAEDVLRSVFVTQQTDGRIPHTIGIFGTSKWTQPPLLSYAAVDISENSHNLNFLREVYPALVRYHEWLWVNRRLANGLFFWQHPYESGMDNSPRFSNRDESQFADTKKIAAIDFSSYAILDSESLEQIAALLLENGPSAAETDALLVQKETFHAQAEELRRLVREQLWDESKGYFFDRDDAGNFIEVPSLASFFPLIAGVPTQAQWAVMRRHLLDPKEFNTPIPFPTVARNSPFFEKDCWRGPVWVNTAYLVIQGLKRYGENNMAQEMSQRLINGIYLTTRNNGKLVEFYDPERSDFEELTRKQGLGIFGLSLTGNLFHDLAYFFGKKLYLGDKPVDHFVGWTGLINNLAIEISKLR